MYAKSCFNTDDDDDDCNRTTDTLQRYNVGGNLLIHTRVSCSHGVQSDVEKRMHGSMI